MIIAIIPAKGTSRRLPNKNMHLVLGKPMLQYAIDYAKSSKRISNIYISTDDKKIADYAKSKKIEVIIRSNKLGGETPLLDVYKHALSSINNHNVSILVGVQPDHPDRNISLDEVLQIFENQNLDLLSSTELDGTKNGAYHMMSVESMLAGEFLNAGVIQDDCTNIHYQSDISLAEERLKRLKQ